MANCFIHYLINIKEGKSILWANIIEVRIIDTHVPLAILLKDDHYIGQPLEVLNLSDEANGEEFVHFLIYDFLVCLVKLP